MRVHRLASAIALITLTLGCAAGPRTQAGWTFLGERQVTDRIDHDRIPVTGRRGDFTRIKLTVHRTSVDFRRVVVHFANGTRQEVEMRRTVEAGGETRAIDLRGADRVIQSVEFWYDPNTIGGRSASVRLLGRR